MNTYRIRERAMNGLPLDDIFIFDCHGHLDYWKAACKFETNADAIVKRMDRVGFDKVCINKWNCPNLFQGNNDVGNALKQYPDRLVGFAATTPAIGRNKIRQELDRCFDDLDMKGVKVHAGYERLPVRDHFHLPEFHDALNAIWEFANEKKCPVLCHGFLAPEVARAYPDAKFISAHACGNRSTVHAYKEYPNVFFDTASSLAIRGNIEYFLENVDIERILFGTDLPYADPAYRLGQVIGSTLNDDQLEKILGLNMAKLFGIDAG